MENSQTRVVATTASALRTDAGKMMRVLAIALLIVFLCMGVFFADTRMDFHEVYYPRVHAWLTEGTSIYAEGVFYNPPWTAFLLAPFVLLPERLSRTALAFFTLVVIALAARYFGQGSPRPATLTALALVSGYSVATVAAGQIDGFALAGLLLAIWAHGHLQPRGSAEDGAMPRLSQDSIAWCLALSTVLVSTKPQALLLAALFLYSTAMIKLTWRQRAIVCGAPVVAVLLSAAAFGVDWPAQWLHAFRREPPIPTATVTTWRAAAQLGLPVGMPLVAVGLMLIASVKLGFRTRPSRETTALWVLAGVISTVYSSPSTNIIVVSVALAHLATARPGLALALYIFNQHPYITAIFGIALREPWPLDLTFWWLLWGGLAFHLLRRDTTRLGQIARFT